MPEAFLALQVEVMSSDQVGGADVDSGRMLMSIADFKKSYQLGISRGAHMWPNADTS